MPIPLYILALANIQFLYKIPSFLFYSFKILNQLKARVLQGALDSACETRQLNVFTPNKSGMR